MAEPILDVPLPDNGPDVSAIPQTLVDPTALENVEPEGMNVPTSFWQSFRGAARAGTAIGVTADTMNMNKVRGRESGYKTDQQRRRETAAKAGGPDAPAYPDLTAQNDAAKMRVAEDNVIEQVMYDLSPSFQSVAGVAGSLAGAVVAPENLIGMQGILARKVPMLAGETIAAVAARTGTEAAILNTVTDPLIQGARLGSGSQAEYDWTQTLAAPVVGAVGGGALGAGAAAAGRALSRVGSPDVPDLALPSNQTIMRQFDPANAQVTMEPPKPRTIEEVVAQPEPAGPINASAIRPVEQAPQTPRPLNLSTMADGTLAPVTRIGNVQLSAPQSISLPSIRRDLGFDIPGTLIESPNSIKAFHGSPHNFDKFSMEKIGTGEGAQAYGHGLYFAESPKVAGEYQRKLSSDNAGAVYEVRINADPEKFLDWDKPLPADSPVRKRILELSKIASGSDDPASRNIAANAYILADRKELSGQGAYYQITRLMDASRDYMKEKYGERALFGKASEFANDEFMAFGFSGIKYLDGGSRQAGEGSRNYVVFDDSLVQIVSKNGEQLKKSTPLIDYLKGQATAKPETPQAIAAKPKSGTVPFKDGPVDQQALFRRNSAGGNLQTIPEQIKGGRPLAQTGTSQSSDASLNAVAVIARDIVRDFSAIARTGRVSPGAAGQYNLKNGAIRIRNYGDLDTLVHELGHGLHFDGGKKPEFDAILKANVSELAPYGAGKSPEGNAEAFAELFALYSLNPRAAEKRFPNAAADLDAILKSEFPKEYDAIQKMRGDLDALYNAPSADVVKANQISAPLPKFGDSFREFAATDRDPMGRRVYSMFDAMYTDYVDKMHPVYRTQEALVSIARKNGNAVDLNPVDQPYILSRMMSGAHGVADAQLKHGVLDVKGINPSGPSLSSGIEKAIGIKFDDAAYNDFGAYLIARRMVEEYNRFFAGDLDRPPGSLSMADYKNAVAAFEAANPNYKLGADDIYAFQKNHLTRLLDKGMISKELYDAMAAKGDYVPLMRDMRDFLDDVATQSSMGGKQGNLLVSSVAKKFRGSDRMVINPLESIFKRVHDLENTIAMNDTVSAIARLADEAGPGAGFIAEKIPNHQLRSQQVDVIDALRAAGKQAGADEADLHILIQQAEDLLGDSSWATLFKQEKIDSGAEPILFYWQNGERRALRLGDRKLGQSLYHSMTAMSAPEKDVFLNTLYMSQAILRSGVTRSLDFIAVNFVRDQITSMLTAGRSYIPFVSAAKGLIDAIAKTDESIAYAARGGAAGGAIVEAMSASAFGRNVKSLQGRDVMGKVLQAFEFSETGTRVGLYKSFFNEAKKIGMDDVNANLWATYRANDYIDFSKHGAKMGMMRKIVPFLNAAIQGSDKEIRSVGALVQLEAKRMSGETLSTTEMERLKDARVAFVRLLALGTVVGGGMAAMNAGNPKYENAPDYVKNANFIFSWMGRDYTIPKGFGIVQTMSNFFERGVDLANRGDQKSATDWLKAAGESFAPPFSNPFVNTYMDLTANYNRFRDRPIVPFYMQGVEPEYQFTPFTSGLAKNVGKMTGVSPMKLEYAFYNFGGGLARDVTFGWDMLMRKDAPEKQIYDYPVARRFIKNLERGSAAQKAFYDLVGMKSGELEKKQNAYKFLIQSGERDEAARYLAGMDADSRAWTVLTNGGFSASVKRNHPLMRAKEYTAIVNGMVRQLAVNNVIKDEELDRRNLTISRREAMPLTVDARQRAQAMDELLGLSTAVTRNSMVAVGAKGTKGLGLMDTGPILERIKIIAPEIHKELEYRLGKKNLPSEKDSFQRWPEFKRRLLTDGEDATFEDMIKEPRRGRRR